MFRHEWIPLLPNHRAEAVFKHAIEKRGISAEFEVDSAGTASYHVCSSFPPLPANKSDYKYSFFFFFTRICWLTFQ